MGFFKGFMDSISKLDKSNDMWDSMKKEKSYEIMIAQYGTTKKIKSDINNLISTMGENSSQRKELYEKMKKLQEIYESQNQIKKEYNTMFERGLLSVEQQIERLETQYTVLDDMVNIQDLHKEIVLINEENIELLKDIEELENKYELSLKFEENLKRQKQETKRKGYSL